MTTPQPSFDVSWVAAHFSAPIADRLYLNRRRPVTETGHLQAQGGSEPVGQPVQATYFHPSCFRIRIALGRSLAANSTL